MGEIIIKVGLPVLTAIFSAGTECYKAKKNRENQREQNVIACALGSAVIGVVSYYMKDKMITVKNNNNEVQIKKA